MASQTSSLETFRLGPFVSPRIWTGLWQLSSNAWGSASVPKIRQGMARHASMGYTAFGTSFSPPRHAILLMVLQIWSVSSPPASHLLTTICCPAIHFTGQVLPSQPTIPTYTFPADHYGSAELIFVRRSPWRTFVGLMFS